MSTTAASITTAVLVLAGLITAVVRIRRAAARLPYLQARWDATRRDWVNETPHDVGPDSLRLLEDLEAHMKAYAETVADFYDTTTGER
ncbi:hypothetical protein [Streptomyces sp. NPDC093060]|uniref:hypothetical protein n=1 Tax=Streptomyces sp. NPDC093060 TaxID=3366019 RepID=UPI0037FD6C43